MLNNGRHISIIFLTFFRILYFVRIPNLTQQNTMKFCTRSAFWRGNQWSHNLFAHWNETETKQFQNIFSFETVLCLFQCMDTFRHRHVAFNTFSTDTKRRTKTLVWANVRDKCFRIIIFRVSCICMGQQMINVKWNDWMLFFYSEPVTIPLYLFTVNS